MTKSEGCIASAMICFLSVAFCAGITFCVSYAIAHLIVSMGILAVGKFKLALLLCLIRMMFFNYNVNVNNVCKNNK